MKKVFSLVDKKIAPERMADKIKNEVKKYIKRERKKSLPEGADFWDFDCHIGNDEQSTIEIHEKEISKSIDQLLESQSESFYLEIIAKSAKRNKKPKF